MMFPSSLIKRLLTESLSSPTEGVSLSPTEGVSSSPTEDVSLSPTEGICLSTTEGLSSSPTEVASSSPTEGVSLLPTCVFSWWPPPLPPPAAAAAYAWPLVLSRGQGLRHLGSTTTTTAAFNTTERIGKTHLIGNAFRPTKRRGDRRMRERDLHETVVGAVAVVVLFSARSTRDHDVTGKTLGLQFCGHSVLFGLIS